MNTKRQGNDDNSKGVKRVRIECSYGENCFRKNPFHFKEYKHSHLERILSSYSGTGDYDIPSSLSFQSDLVHEQLNILKDNHVCELASSSISTVNGSLTSDKHVEKIDKKCLQSSQSSSQNSTQASSQIVKECKEIINETQKSYMKDHSKQSQSDSVSNNSKMGHSTSSTGDTRSQPSSSPSSVRRIEDYFSVVAPRGKMAEKHQKAAPFYIFYTTITASKPTHNQPLSITFQELLDKSLGELHSSLQINFMIDIGWLLAHYHFAGYGNKPLTILYGEDTPDIKSIGSKRKNIQSHFVEMATPFGKHHTKMSVLCYEDGSVRVVVSTANLYIDDWENRTQGLWLSPKCPALPDGSMPHDGDSPTGFKKSLISYLSHYKMSCLSPFIDKVKMADFSDINVFFVASVPGSHFDPSWGMTRMGTLLSKYCRVPEAERAKWDLIAQASSIGSYGKEPKLWLTGDFLNQFSRSAMKAMFQTGPPTLKLIYPSLENVQGSHDGMLGGGCLPYAASAHTKQTWLMNYLHQWKATNSQRDRAMPHIKSYLRLSPCGKKAAFFHLTSGNVSKAAWGIINKGNGALRIMSYEAGVLFLPEFVVKSNFFSLDSCDELHIPIPYDLPPVRYTAGMSPWVMDYLH